MGRYSIQIDKSLFTEIAAYFLFDDEDTPADEHYRRYLKIRHRLCDVVDRAAAHDRYSELHGGVSSGGNEPDGSPSGGCRQRES